MIITVVGTGFVGVVTAAVYASFGNSVWGVDIDSKKIALLKKGVVPFFEPNLSELLLEQQQAGTLSFTTEYKEAVSQSEVIVLAVGTPSKENGEADLQYVLAACDSLAEHLKDGSIVVVKSTVPPGTLKIVTERIKQKTSVSFSTASVPEFLKEGTAVEDTLHPDRVVIGATDAKTFAVLEALHSPLSAPVVRVSPESAQLAKYTANAYLATRITFINQVATLCDVTGADVTQVIEAIGHDVRIGHHYWYPGFGYGGSCFPKDVKELAAFSRKVGVADNFFSFLDASNEARPKLLLSQYGEKIGGWKDKRVAVLGLSFKPNTDDMRVAPSLVVVPELHNQGVQVVAYDPKALKEAHTHFGMLDGIEFSDSIQEAVAGADVVIALIEWQEIVSFDFSKLGLTKGEQRWFIDARNQFDPATIQSAGFTYLGMGRNTTTDV